MRGGVRLISSASRTLVKTAPGENVSSPRRRTSSPVISSGRVSGVNWTRLKETPRTRAIPLAMSVFATPGGPSSRTWPPATAATISRSSASLAPITTPSSSERTCLRRSSSACCTFGTCDGGGGGAEES